jgi:hypothetical protein
LLGHRKAISRVFGKRIDRVAGVIFRGLMLPPEMTDVIFGDYIWSLESLSRGTFYKKLD